MENDFRPETGGDMEIQHATVFDNYSLGDLAEKINNGHEELHLAVRRMAVHVAQVGAWLTAAKAKCQHGEWYQWLDSNCAEITRRTATNYMRTYDKAISNRKLISDLTPKQAYKALGVVKPATEMPELPPPPELKAELSLLHTDALAFLGDLPDQSVDLLLTDPPYITDTEGHFADFVERWTNAALRKVKTTGQGYICTGSYPEELGAYLAVLSKQDHLRLEDVLVWEYRNTLGPKPKNNYKRNWQAVLYLRGKDAPPLNCPIMLEQFAVKNINAPGGFGNPNERRLHPWQKPDDLAEQFVRHGSAEGNTVIDPFAGTGTFLLQAAKWGRNAYGAEIDSAMLKIAIERGCSCGS